MNANIDFIEDINTRYSCLEMEIDKKLITIEAAETKFDEFNNMSDVKSVANQFDPFPPTLNEARVRNRKFIEELDVVKARLRTKVLYSPLEQILEKARNNYFAAMKTPLKKKYGPIFV